MGKKTEISWCDATFNLVWGCTKVSDGCKNCYASSFSHRLGKDLWGPNAERQVMSDSYWRQPLKWNRQAQVEGVRRRVFCSSMADVFEDHPTVEGERFKLWELIRETPMLDWLLLTKRPENIYELIPLVWLDAFPRNVWLGTTVENQEAARERIPQMQRTCATMRGVRPIHFLSVEPLLEPIDFGFALAWLDWVIVGGESGHGARLMKQEWAESVLEQCRIAACPVFFKQTGEVLARQLGLKDKKGGDFDELPVSLQRREWPIGVRSK